MIERAAAAHRSGLDSLFVGDQHVSSTPYYQNTPMLGRLLAEWGEAPAGCLFLLPMAPGAGGRADRDASRNTVHFGRLGS
jgi:alkanesulfonate monooxygenase SsuD/methylene tetrahydromethanopterin reductase-like flavin-dependent oxidoreductase (luciferase family)